MRTLHWETATDARSLDLLVSGFRVHSDFQDYEHEDLAAMDVLAVLAKP
jgi:hypothetical protein